MPLPTAPCDPWVTPAEIAELACYEAAASDENEALAETAALWATTILHNLSHSTLGLCTVTSWPALRGCSTDNCNGCDEVRTRIDLGPDPVSEVTTVVVVDSDGVETTLDSGSYRLDDWRWLTRADGEKWPHRRCSGSTPEGVKTTVVYGVAPDVTAKLAASILAAEEMKRCLNQACSLPTRVRTVTVQGQSFTVMDPMEMIEKRRTGIYQVDLWLTTADHSNDARLFDPGSNWGHARLDV